MKHSLIIMAIIALLVALSSCGSNKQVSASYSGVSSVPANPVQASAVNRGVKIEVEECEEMATDITAENPREFGNGVSAKESFATNLAILDARSKMAQRITAYVKGLIINAEGQTQSSNSYQGMAGQVQTAQWDQYVSNAKVIKKNTYVKEDGQYNVYVCIEMPKEQLKQIYDNLSNDKTISAKITESMFLEGFKMVEIQ